MRYEKIQPLNKDNSVNIIIEIPANGNVKYELNKEAEIIEVDRFGITTMHYPCNYGLIPNTLGGDGDPLDALIITRTPLHPGVLIAGKVIGVLMMEDDGGMDEKIICVPTARCDKLYANVNSYKDLPEMEIEKIVHFFEKYKDLEKGKWVKITGWKDADEAMEIVHESIARCKE
jgi:inorganic pyrophosphatase